MNSAYLQANKQHFRIPCIQWVIGVTNAVFPLQPTFPNTGFHPSATATGLHLREAAILTNPLLLMVILSYGSNQQYGITHVAE